MDNKNIIFTTGEVIDGKWVILDFLGKGGMGEVYLAHQLNLDRRVAIKVISKQWINSFEGDIEAINSSLERFRREVQIMAQVRHPNVLQIHDYGTFAAKEGDQEEIKYIVMEYVSGGDLRSSMSEEGFFPEEDRVKDWLSRYFLPLLEGVKALHGAGIIHRDLKPENVLLCENVPKIADFGLARSSQFKPITRSIEMQGTPFYKSPEHFLDLKRTDERTDIYALGKILYEALCGKGDPKQVPFKKAILPQAETPLFQKLDLIIQTATAEKREERFPSVQALSDALNEVVGEGKYAIMAPLAPTPAKRAFHFRTLIFTAALVLAGSVATGLGTFVYERARSPKPITEPSLDARTPAIILPQPEQSIMS